MASESKEKSLIVTQIRSVIGQKPKTKATLKALGLGAIGKTRKLPARAEILGMIKKVSHLVSIKEESNA